PVAFRNKVVRANEAAPAAATRPAFPRNDALRPRLATVASRVASGDAGCLAVRRPNDFATLATDDAICTAFHAMNAAIRTLIAFVDPPTIFESAENAACNTFSTPARAVTADLTVFNTCCWFLLFDSQATILSTSLVIVGVSVS